MEELTVRLPAETKNSLQADAAERGVTVSEHIRDILDSYQGRGDVRDRPDVEVEYVHAISEGVPTRQTDEETTSTGGEEIGTFMYGSKSIFS